MQKDIKAKTGQAEIKKTGHTASNRFGMDHNAQMKGGKTETRETGIRG
jgi:hypothetical protein